MPITVIKFLFLISYFAIGIGTVYKSLTFFKKNTPRWSYILVTLFTGKLIFDLVSMLPSGTHAMLNSARLAPALSVRLGNPLYYPPDSGPVLSSMYSPLTFLTYLPATLFSEPTISILFGLAIAQLLFFVPAVLLFLTSSQHHNGTRHIAFLSFLAFGFLTISSKSLNYAAFSIHSDAGAVCFAALGCMTLSKLKLITGSWKYYILPCILFTIAIWTKQVVIFVPAACLFILFLRHGLKKSLTFFSIMLALNILVTLVFTLIIEFKTFTFNILTYPASFNLTIPFRDAFNAARDEFFTSSLFLIFTVFYLLTSISWSRETFKTHVLNTQWFTFVLSGIFLIPISILAYMKPGGDYNSFAFANYMLTLGALLLMLHLSKEIVTNDKKNPAKLLLIAFLSYNAVTYLPNSIMRIKFTLKLEKNDSQIAYNFAKKHKGEAYFPLIPLATLMSDKTLYHYQGEVMDHNLTTFNISKSHFEKHIPKNLRYVIYGTQPNPSELIDPFRSMYLPDFTIHTELPDLPGWIVLMKNQVIERGVIK
ncbi:MAG: hypothetical protein AAB116_05990 [Candidatus Poribacteria bacterium]